MRVRNISKKVLYYVKIHRKHIGKTIVVHNLKVHSHWTRRRPFDGVKHVALALEKNDSIHTKRGTCLHVFIHADAGVLTLTRPV